MSRTAAGCAADERWRDDFAAGSTPAWQRLEVLRYSGIATEGLRSKSWDEFATPDAPHRDLVITVCDNAAGEACPYWPGQPATAHWGYADPSETESSEAQNREAFRLTLLDIHHRLELFAKLPPAAVERLVLQTSARRLAGS